MSDRLLHTYCDQVERSLSGTLQHGLNMFACCRRHKQSMRTPARLLQRLPQGCGATCPARGPWHSAAGRQALFLPCCVAHASNCLSTQKQIILLHADIAVAHLEQRWDNKMHLMLLH